MRTARTAWTAKRTYRSSTSVFKYNPHLGLHPMEEFPSVCDPDFLLLAHPLLTRRLYWRRTQPLHSLHRRRRVMKKILPLVSVLMTPAACSAPTESTNQPRNANTATV